MFNSAPALILVLLAALQVVAASNSPITLDIGKHSDVAKVMEKSSWEEMGEDVAMVMEKSRWEEMGDNSGHESPLTVVEDDNSTSRVLTLPYFPMIIYLGGVSMSLIDISIEGLDLVDLPSGPNFIPIKGVITIPIRYPSLSLNAGSYVAGGSIKTLPFVGTGSSSAHIDLINLNIALSYHKQEGFGNFCPMANSTKFNMTLDRLIINFEDLNPGLDSGDVINAMLSSVTDDVTKMINLLLNKPAAVDLLERLLVSVISNLTSTNCTSGHSSGDDEHDLEGDLGGHGYFFAGFTQVLENLAPMLSVWMEDFGEAKSFFELVGDLLTEIDLGNSEFTK